MVFASLRGKIDRKKAFLPLKVCPTTQKVLLNYIKYQYSSPRNRKFWSTALDFLKELICAASVG